MRRAELAKLLISATNDAERKRLLVQNRRIADERLANEIRKACYAVWAVEPIKAQRAVSAMRALIKLNDSVEMRATAFWVAGISDITKGKFASAVSNLDTASERFELIGKANDSAQAQVANLIALAMLGRYDEAIERGGRALKIFVKEKDHLAAGKIEMNLSNIVSRRSQHREAEQYCLSARRRFIKAGERSWKAMAENGLANTYAEINDFQKAERFYRVALETARAEKMLVTEAEIEASLGNLAMMRGRYADALHFLELSRQKYEELGMPHQSAIADLEIAGIYSQLNLGAEAAEIYSRVTRSFHQLKLRAEEARSRLNYGGILASLGELSAAEREMNRALSLFEKEKNHTGRASSLLTLLEFAFKTRNFGSAGKYLTKAAAAVRLSENPRHKIHLTLLEGELLRNAGHLAEANDKLSEAYKLAKDHQQSDAEQSVLNSLGKIAILQGENAKAKRYFSDAIRSIEDLRSYLSSEEFSMAYFGSKLEPFKNLAELLLKENYPTAAFDVIESGRARALLAASPTAARKSKISEKLEGKRNELRAELNFYYKKFDSAEPSETERLTTAIERLETELSATLRKIASLHITRSNSKGKKNDGFGLPRLQKQLGDSATLVEYVEIQGKVSAFVITRDKVKYIREMTTIETVNNLLEELHFHFGSLRYGNDQLRKFTGSLKARADISLKKLYDLIVRPLAQELRGRRLVVVPVGSLNYVPFQALRDETKYIIEKCEISYAPSARVWSSLQGKRGRPLKSSLLFGYADERIPLVESEIREISSKVPQPRVFVGKNATFSSFIDNSPYYDVIHLACHGRFRSENPMFSSLHLADGWITVRDVCAQRLSATLVTLSACETGLNKIFAGEEILGLARGFLRAGASSLIVSLWNVNDAATGVLMSHFYENLQRGGGISASLRAAQLGFIERGEHPFYWSPFVLIGK